MSIVASELIAKVAVEGATGAEAQLTGVGAASEGAGGKLKMLALGGLAIAGAALIGIGVASVKMAGDFQAGLTSLVTGAGEAQSNLQMVSDGILAMSVKTGTSTKDLIAGMYMIESAGYHGAAGLQILLAASEGAKVGSASLADVANTVTSALNAYGLKASQAGNVTNTLIAIVASGKMHMQDLAGALATVLPAASAAGVSLQEVGAALATMTMQGTPAADAATYLKQMLIGLEAPGSKAAKTLAEIGLSSAQVAMGIRKTPDGLVTTLEQISEALSQKFPNSAAIARAEFARVTKGQETMDQALANLAKNTSPAYVEALKNIAGGSKNMQALLELTGAHLGMFKDNLTAITSTVLKGAGGITGWNRVQEDFNFQMDKAKAAVEAVFIVIGLKLLPILTPLVARISSMLVPFASWIASGHEVGSAMSNLGTWIMTKVVPPIQKMMEVVGPLIADLIQGAIHSGAFQAALGMIATVVPYLVTGLANVVTFLARIAKWALDNQAAFTALKIVVMVLAGAALAVLVVGLALVAVTLGVVLLAVLAIAAPIIGIVLLVQHWGQIMHWFQGVWSTVWGAISSFAVGVWNHIAGFFAGVWNGMVNNFKMQWNMLVSFITGVWKTIVGIFQGAIETVVGWFMWLFNHNYYFHNLVLNIMGAFMLAKNFIIGVWTAIVGFLTGKWQEMVKLVQWGMKTQHDVIFGALSAIGGFFRTIWTAISSFLVGAWNTISKGVIAAWTYISSIFSGAWNKYIAGPLGTLATNLGNFFGGLANTALQWGKNLIQGLINGIESMLGGVGKAAGDIVGQFAKFLGFHSPTEKGPGRYADTWMPALMKMLAKGIQAGVPSIHAAVSMAVAPIARFSAPSRGSFAPVSTPYAFPAMQAQAPIIIINVPPSIMNIDGHRMVSALMPGISSAIRYSTGSHL